MTEECPPKTFTNWVHAARRTVDPAGDLVEDLQRDRSKRDFKTLNEFEGYLISQNACEGAMDAAKQVWKRFEKWCAA